MKIIRQTPNEGGAYPPIQEGSFRTVPEGYALWPDNLSAEAFYEHNGFVTLTIQDGVVQSCAPNVEAWEEWKASLPPDEPDTPVPQTDMDKMAAAYREGVESA